MKNEWFKRAVVETRSAALAAWDPVHLVFFARRCSDTVPRVAAHGALGPHIERATGNLLAGGRTVMAETQTQNSRIADRLLAFHLWRCLHPSGRHALSGLGGG